MVIDPRRLRRGHAEGSVLPWKALTAAAVAIAWQAAPTASSAQSAPTASGAQSAPTASGAQAAAAGNSGGAPRDPWRLTSAIGVDETWSDNINLAPAGSQRSDYVTSISPSLRLTRLSPTLTANFDYQPQFIYYARGTNGSALRNTLDASANAILIQNLLTFDAAAAVTQQNVSPFGTQAANTVNGSANRAEARTFSFGPTLQSRFGRDLSYSAGYRYLSSSSNNNAYATSHTSQIFGQFQTSTSFRDVGIGGNYSRSDQAYGGVNEIIVESLGSTLTYVVVPTFHLSGNIGYDKNSYPTTGQPELKGASYSAGFDWEPTHHSSLKAQVGHRYFGPTANIVLQQTTSRFALSASYVRDQTTSTGSGVSLVQDPNYALVDQFYRATITDPVARAAAVTTALQQLGLPVSQYGVAGFLSNQIYVQKRAEISLALLGLRNTVTFDVARGDSQALSAITSGFDIFNQSSKFRTTSYSANWSHQLGPRTFANAAIFKAHNQSVQGSGDSRQRIFTVSLSRQLQQRLSANVLYRNTTQTSDSNNSGFFSGNYRENAVLGSLRLTF